MNNNPKVLTVDIETAPNRVWMWSMWQEWQQTIMMDKEWFILCFCAKWLEDKKVISSALPDFKNYKPGFEDDKEILKKLWNLLDEADIVITHNGIKFDRKKINARFMFHGMTPPSPYKMVDTCLIAKSLFGFTSNKLADIVEFLKLGKKMDTGGFELWEECLNGNKKSWKKMIKYCKNDVVLTEKVYLKLRPYVVNHPNIGVYEDSAGTCCPKCGGEKIHYRGYAYTNVSKFRRFVCTVCGGWGRERLNVLSKDKRNTLATNVSY